MTRYTYLASLPPVHHEVKSDQLPFPFGVRAGMIGWDLMFFANMGDFKPVATELPAWNCGAYLVDGLEHCAACHTDAGVGVPEIFPSLKASPIVQADNPLTVIRVVLNGAQSVATPAAPTASGHAGLRR